ncbi:MAG: hypothetical protein WBL27_13055 [Salinimicrobium sp.]
MKKALFFSLIASLILSTTVNAQIGAPGSAAGKNRNDTEEYMNQFLKGIKKNEDASDNIDGTPYLNSEFQQAMLVFPENKPLQAMVRYNVAKEEMQIKMDDEGYRVLHPDVVVEFNNVPYKMMYYRGEDKTMDLIGYFEVLSPEQKDGVQLLRKNRKSVRRGRAAAAMQKATPARYVDKDDFYLKFGDSKPVMAESRTKNFIKMFPAEDQKELKKYMKENHLKAKDKQDLLTIVHYYNSKD